MISRLILGCARTVPWHKPSILQETHSASQSEGRTMSRICGYIFSTGSDLLAHLDGLSSLGRALSNDSAQSVTLVRLCLINQSIELLNSTRAMNIVPVLYVSR